MPDFHVELPPGPVVDLLLQPDNSNCVQGERSARQAEVGIRLIVNLGRMLARDASRWIALATSTVGVGCPARPASMAAGCESVLSALRRRQDDRDSGSVAPSVTLFVEVLPRLPALLEAADH